MSEDRPDDPVDLSGLEMYEASRYAAKRAKHPRGWAPGFNTETGEIVHRTSTRPDGDDPAVDWEWLLVDYGLDPERFQVQGDQVEVRSWDAAVGDGKVERFYYYKARIVRMDRGEADDLTRLADWIRSRPHPHHPRPRKSRSKQPPASYCLNISDPQIGKEPTEDTFARITDILDQVPDDIARLRDEGHRLDDFVLGWLGDGCENVTGFYSSQTSQVVGSFRKQIAAAKEIGYAALDILVDEFPQGRGRAVFCASNHGEFRLAGKALTNPRTDNLDLLVGDWIADKCHGQARFANVDFLVPGPDEDGNLAIAIDCHGQVVGYTHGHQFERGSGGGPATARAWGWLKGQIAGERNVESVDVLQVGHYHHDTYVQKGDRYIQVNPPLDVGSVYFEEGTGEASVPGVVRFVARAGLRYPEARRVLYPKKPEAST